MIKHRIRYQNRTLKDGTVKRHAYNVTFISTKKQWTDSEISQMKAELALRVPKTIIMERYNISGYMLRKLTEE